MKGPETRGQGTTHFHYDRDERMAGREKDDDKPRLGLFRRNRGLAITFLDIALLLLVFALYLFFLAPQAGIKRIDGVEFKVSAFVFDQDLFITVDVERFREPREGLPQDSIVQVRFPDGVEALDVVPVEVDQLFTLRSVISGNLASSLIEQDSVRVNISAMGEDFELSVDIDR